MALVVFAPLYLATICKMSNTGETVLMRIYNSRFLQMVGECHSNLSFQANGTLW